MTLSIAIVSGKGGVGKSNIALNLAYALHNNNERVLLMDCDMGLANLDILLGITPEHSAENLLSSDINPADVAVPLTPDGLSFIPASSGVSELTELTPALRTLFLERLNPFAAQFDYMILDVGAGITDMVQMVAGMATMRIVIITPEPTSLTDSYALMKVMSTNHGIKDFFILVNQAENKEEDDFAFNRLASACKHFLDFTPKRLGCIRHDSMMNEAVRMQKPLLLYAKHAKAAQDLTMTAAKIHQLRIQVANAHPGEPPLKWHDNQQS